MARSETYMVCSGGIATIVRGWVVSDGGTTKSVLLGSVTESGTTLNARDVLLFETVLHQLLDVVDDIHDIRLRGPGLQAVSRRIGGRADDRDRCIVGTSTRD